MRDEHSDAPDARLLSTCFSGLYEMAMPPMRRRSTFDLITPDLRFQPQGNKERSRSPVHGLQAHNSPQRPVSEAGWPSGPAPDDRSSSPSLPDQTPATRRFSMLRWRHFSDSHLSTRAKAQAEQDERPPMPDLPSGQATPGGEIQSIVTSRWKLITFTS